MKLHLRMVGLFLAISTSVVACGSGDIEVRAPRTDEPRRDYATSQKWLDRTLGFASMAVDVSSVYPHDIVVSQVDRDVTGVVVGAISGPASLRTYGDSPFVPAGVSESAAELSPYSFIVLPVSVESSAGPQPTELWIELGLVESAEERLAEVLRSAPSPGTRVVAVGRVYDEAMVLPAGFGVVLSENDGASAIAGRGSVEIGGVEADLPDPEFAEIERRTLEAAGL